jgi:hypothetical protein
VNILDFGHKVLGLTYTPVQAMILGASRGEELTPQQAVLFERHAGRPWPGPSDPPAEVVAVLGRQCGKTGFIVPTIALHAATVADLPPGYQRDILCVAPTLRQARILFGRLRGLVASRPQLRRYLKTETQHEIELDFGVRIGVWPARGASLRGLQARLLVLDEACVLPAEGARADYDITEAVTPGMANVPGAQVWAISTPWVEHGWVYDRFRRRADLSDTIVFQASSAQVYPSISSRFLEKEKRSARERGDDDYFSREYGAEFSGTTSTFVPGVSIEACTVAGRMQVPPVKGTRYVAALDQAFRRDNFALVIGHVEGENVVIDRVHGWTPTRKAPLKLETLLPLVKAELADYGVRMVHGDQFAAEVTRELLRREGLVYVERPFTSDSKREMYSTLKAAIVGGTVELLDHQDSLRELRMLTATVAPSGTVRIEAPHGAGFHDDFADCLAIVVHELHGANKRTGLPCATFNEATEDPSELARLRVGSDGSMESNRPDILRMEF